MVCQRVCLPKECVFPLISKEIICLTFSSSLRGPRSFNYQNVPFYVLLLLTYWELGSLGSGFKAEFIGVYFLTVLDDHSVNSDFDFVFPPTEQILKVLLKNI